MSFYSKFSDDFNRSTTYLIVGGGEGIWEFADDITDNAKDFHNNLRSPEGNPREQWTIIHMDGAYTIKSVEHGSYLGFHGSSVIGTKEPFAWTIEPHKKDDGTIRFTIPNTDMYLDFARESSEHKADEAKDSFDPPLGGYGFQSYTRAPQYYRSK